MANTSATGGPLVPNPSPAPQPLEGSALMAFLQGWVVGLTGLSGQMVRPRWQTEPPDIPTQGTVWAAIGIERRSAAGSYPAVVHLPDSVTYPNGADQLQRHEEIDLQCSFYDQGQGGQADTMASLLRDGCAIAQNLELLTTNGFGYVGVGDVVTLPSLTKQTWMVRCDLTVSLRRAIIREYPVLDVASATATVTAQDVLGGDVTVNVTATP